MPRMTTTQRAAATIEGRADMITPVTPPDDASLGDVRNLREKVAGLQKELETMRGRETALERHSHDQESRASEPMHDEHDNSDWEIPALLDHPALRDARPGMALLWVRTTVKGEADGGNVFRKLNEGWRPVDADTLPEALRGVLEVDFRDAKVIGVHGLVLMERPQALHERHIKQVRAASRHQMFSVEERLGRTHQAGDHGFHAPRFTQRTSRIETGLMDEE